MVKKASTKRIAKSGKGKKHHAGEPEKVGMEMSSLKKKKRGKEKSHPKENEAEKERVVTKDNVKKMAKTTKAKGKVKPKEKLKTKPKEKLKAKPKDKSEAKVKAKFKVKPKEKKRAKEKKIAQVKHLEDFQKKKVIRGGKLKKSIDHVSRTSLTSLASVTSQTLQASSSSPASSSSQASSTSLTSSPAGLETSMVVDRPHPQTIPPARAQTFAAIDVGSTGIRMLIADIDDQGHIRPLETLQQPVRLGKDTFTRGRIEQETIEECVRVLLGFRRVLEEYGVQGEERIRAIATSSVREATNRDTFLDRLYIATGIPIEAVEEAEENRLTYLAVRYIMPHDADLSGESMIVEVGGGNTDLLLLEEGHITFANSFRLGSLRVRENLETYRAPVERMRQILDSHLRTTIDQVRRNVPATKLKNLIAVSGDMRFAASRLCPDWESTPIASLNAKTFAGFAEKMAAIPVDELVRREHLSYQDAETIGPALLAYKHLAHAFGVSTILVPKTSLREGILQEMAARGSWSGEFAEQVLHSAQALGEKYRFDARHAQHVAMLSIDMFRSLREEHGLGTRYELLLHLAALLHDIGMFISNRAHHKHSMYLILNSDLFGLTLMDKIIIGLIARYHRRASPGADHQEYAMLTRDSRMAVAKLAAILRVADALDRNHLQGIRNVTWSREERQFLISIPDVEDLTLERFALKEKGSMFEEVYGLKVVLRRATAG
ncbi:MAG: HD domain-containing protein [Candidatus Ozemobacteraceae bacterium]